MRVTPLVASANGQDVGLVDQSWLEPSVTLGWRDLLLNEVLDVAEECESPNWDGYDAKPIGEDQIRSAIELIQSLPNGILLPDVVPEPGGAIGLEWNRDNSWLLALSIDDDELVYASILGSDSRNGRERFSGEIPEVVSEILLRYFSD